MSEKKPAERLHVDGYSYILEGKIEEPARSEIELKSLVGLKMLDAVDFANERRQRWGDEWEDCNVCRFRLDGKTYLAIEDPRDGYRSSLASLSEYVNEVPMQNVFPHVQVMVIHRTKGSYGHDSDKLELIDVKTGQCVLEVGTDNSDDYYPSFVASFHPEAMATNA